MLGSTQPSAHVDAGAAARAGLTVVRRRSGGGAVLVEPAGVVWVDVGVPRSDPLWDDDVGRAFWWLGQAWAQAVGTLGLHGAEVHRRAMVSSPWSSMVCFAGLGPGEVTVGGRKVVGMAQRRTRQGALFQCAVPLAWHPERLLGVLVLDGQSRAAAGAELADAAMAVGASAGDVEDALVEALPRDGEPR